MTVLLWILLAAAVLMTGMGFFLAHFSMTIRRQTLEEARKWQEAHYDISWYDGMEKQDYLYTSYDGYVLHAQLLIHPRHTDRCVLISHGYTDNHIGSLKYTKMYLDLGYNVLLYDLRGHGENEKTFCTYSIRESRDLDGLIRDARQRFPQFRVFGIHGESLGSATSAACMQYHPDIDFAVLDCGFSEIISVMQRGLQGMHLPPWMVHVASVCAKVRYGYYFHEMRPVDALTGNKVPMLFIHGAEDDFILPVHSERMHQATEGYSAVHLVAGAGHAASVLTAPEEYKKAVQDFFRAVNVDFDE